MPTARYVKFRITCSHQTDPCRSRTACHVRPLHPVLIGIAPKSTDQHLSPVAYAWNLCNLPLITRPAVCKLSIPHQLDDARSCMWIRLPTIIAASGVTNNREVFTLHRNCCKRTKARLLRPLFLKQGASFKLDCMLIGICTFCLIFRLLCVGRFLNPTTQSLKVLYVYIHVWKFSSKFEHFKNKNKLG